MAKSDVKATILLLFQKKLSLNPDTYRVEQISQNFFLSKIIFFLVIIKTDPASVKINIVIILTTSNSTFKIRGSFQAKSFF